MLRDFTYIDDIVEGVVRAMENPPVRKMSSTKMGSIPPYSIYNIGNNQPVELTDLIRLLEQKIGKNAIIEWYPMQPGDVPLTYADITELSNAVGYRPKTPINKGVDRFVDWYRDYYKLGWPVFWICQLQLHRSPWSVGNVPRENWG